VPVWARNRQVPAAAYQAGSATLTHVALDGHHAIPRAVAAALHDWCAAAGARDRRADRVSISLSRELCSGRWASRLPSRASRWRLACTAFDRSGEVRHAKFLKSV
jgi:hypothetical protein